MNKPLCLVFSGPSGAGKSTLLKMLMKNYPDRFAFSVSHTTRQMRQGETHGLDYHFVAKDMMLTEIKGGKFLEHAEFAGNVYGTSRGAVESVLSSGRICILDVEIQGVKSIHSVQPPLNAQYILIRPPSVEALEKRLRERGTETEDSLNRRLTRARQDIDLVESAEGRHLFDKVIINDDLHSAYHELEQTLRSAL